ncbi:MAG: ATP-dependent DNA helicase RecG [Bacteroidales bacterium]|nr:ATP-dependent DNA helicase RecG [Bacteroidales bacterium]MDD4656480.1 ATP-dependent DNA helicase RecG [Bacteroidales bacterium]
MPNMLESEIKYLPGVGPKRAELLNKELGIKTYRDMLYFFPFRYIDRTKIYSISEIEPSMSYIQLRGKVTRVNVIGDKPRSKRLVATFQDPTGIIDLVFFQRIKWIKEWIKPNSEYIVFGKPSYFNQVLNMVHPEIELATEENPIYVGNMLGVYPSTERLKKSGFSNKQIAKFMATLLKRCQNSFSETLPTYTLFDKKLLSLSETLQNIHFPKDIKTLSQAQYRLKFEELFYLQLSLLKQKSTREKSNIGIKMGRVGNNFNTCFKALPFELTNAQKRVIKEIRQDLVSGRQMNRLLQGDVGSGKTMVAIFTALLAADNGYQSCIMAPTEVLAGQHYKGSLKLLEKTNIKTALLTGSTKAKERKILFEELLNGGIDILFGTHAVIEENVQFKNLGFAVIDEQHRFGVDQRSKLWSKGDTLPHILVMTATPIPRTLAMTLYGDLDVSIIDELPPGRKPVKTLHTTDNQTDRIYLFMREQIKKGRQIFIVYPLIKESEKMDYKNLQEGYMSIIEEFKAPEFITAVVHGKQKSQDKAHDMELFASGKAHILVATSVIEVGVDIPNASVMIIESAERFGLSQLHQLRGRVGRGAEESWCILKTGYKLSKESRQRIELMCSTNDGFELAEADLRMRGPGNMEGTQQSGLPVDLKISNLAKDFQILEESRRYAQAILEQDPLITDEKNRVLKTSLSLLKREQKDYSQIS